MEKGEGEQRGSPTLVEFIQRFCPDSAEVTEKDGKFLLQIGDDEKAILVIKDHCPYEEGLIEIPIGEEGLGIKYYFCEECGGYVQGEVYEKPLAGTRPGRTSVAYKCLYCDTTLGQS